MTVRREADGRRPHARPVRRALGRDGRRARPPPRAADFLRRGRATALYLGNGRFFLFSSRRHGPRGRRPRCGRVLVRLRWARALRRCRCRGWGHHRHSRRPHRRWRDHGRFVRGQVSVVAVAVAAVLRGARRRCLRRGPLLRGVRWAHANHVLRRGLARRWPDLHGGHPVLGQLVQPERPVQEAAASASEAVRAVVQGRHRLRIDVPRDHWRGLVLRYRHAGLLRHEDAAVPHTLSAGPLSTSHTFTRASPRFGVDRAGVGVHPR